MSSNPLFDAVHFGYSTIKSLDVATLKDLVFNAHKYYYTWWINLYKESPHHVIVETGLVLFIIWLFFIRATVNPRKAPQKSKLSRREEEWLIQTWQPEKLVPAPMLSTTSSSMKVIVQELCFQFKKFFRLLTLFEEPT